MPEEPLHETRAAALEWVVQNTDNVVWTTVSGLDDPITVRIDARGHVYELRRTENNEYYYWARMREMVL
jgi:hypothetical protein